MESDIIKISHLNKSFGEVKAVNDLSFRVKKGELFAFLGVNGAGKSTTISILCGLLKKDSGTVQVNGIETDKAGAQTKRMLGVVFQDSVLDKPLTVKENLMSRAALYGITGNAFDKRLQELVEILDFDEFLNRPVGKLSGGQRRRIDIARALLHRPEILILDEPTTGLDPQTRQLIWNVIEKLQKTENMTVFLTTHYMEEAANAGYVVILDSFHLYFGHGSRRCSNRHSNFANGIHACLSYLCSAQKKRIFVQHKRVFSYEANDNGNFENWSSHFGVPTANKSFDCAN